MTDLSKEGAFIETDEGIPQNTAIMLAISFPNRDPIVVKALVMRQVNDDLHKGIGIRFLYADIEQVKQIITLLEALDK